MSMKIMLPSVESRRHPQSSVTRSVDEQQIKIKLVKKVKGKGSV